MAIRIQCSACNKTLQVADTAAGKKARCPSCQTLNDVPSASSPVAPSPAAPVRSPAKPVQNPVPTSTPKPPAAAAASGAAATPANPKPDTMLITCANCKKQSRAPKTLAGKTVQCPSCKAKIVVPGGNPTAKPSQGTSQGAAPKAKPASSGSVDIFASVPSSPSAPSNDIFGSLPAAPSYDSFGGSDQGNNSLWNEIGDQSGGGGWQAMPAASTPANQGNPYASGYGGGYSGGGYSAPARSSARSPAVYIICGIGISLWGFLSVISSLWMLGVLVLLVSNMDPRGVFWDRVALNAIGCVLGLIFGGIQLFGGISMAMRKNLAFAKTTAVVCTIPCFGGLCFPFGIWALVLLFSGSSGRDFRD